MATPQTNVRLSPGIKSQAVAAAAAEEISLSQFVERALVAWLSGECTGADTTRDTGADTGDGTALALIPELVSRVEAIERRLATPSPSIPTAAAPTPPPKHPSQNRREGASKPAQVSGHPTESPQKADGGRWLTTSQAVEVSQARGGTGNSSTLKRRGRRCETEVIGLRWIARPPSKDNSLASFEDLLWGG